MALAWGTGPGGGAGQDILHCLNCRWLSVELHCLSSSLLKHDVDSGAHWHASTTVAFLILPDPWGRSPLPWSAPEASTKQDTSYRIPQQSLDQLSSKAQHCSSFLPLSCFLPHCCSSRWLVETWFTGLISTVLRRRQPVPYRSQPYLRMPADHGNPRDRYAIHGLISPASCSKPTPSPS